MIRFKHYASFKTDVADTHKVRQYIPVDDLFRKYVTGTLTELRPEDFGNVTEFPIDCLKGGNLLETSGSIKLVEFPDNVKNIPDGFMQFYLWERIIFPPFLETIGKGCFSTSAGSTGIADFSKATKVPSVDYTSYYTLSSFAQVATVMVPDALYDDWIASSDWQQTLGANFADIIVAV